MASGQHFLGPFQLVRIIRAGQTCQVWEALRTGTDERVALKVLLQEHVKKKDQVEALRHEADVGKTLDHPRVIKIHGFYQQHSLPFIAMELFTANNLKQEVRDYLDRLLLDIDAVLIRCCEGLAHLHKKGWLHCDMKPDNFLINPERVVKLIDFSIAQKLAKSSIFGGWGSKSVSGTRSYMAPEQILSKSLTIATDVYGLGCTFFEMVSGKLPYTAGNPNELLSKHLSATIPSVLPANNFVSDAFADILMKMMAKKPADRYQSIETVLSEIKKIRVLRPGSQKKVQARIDGVH
ncbi:MAG: serine/threonine-protein kinase [Pirellulaceae bacterium]|nr:serine/threonine-protein kinase [Pirellulaceae bacterium]